MLYTLGVWIVGLLLVSPVFVLGLAWARIRWFYASRQTSQRGKLFYLTALAAASVSTLTYLCYWGWRLCELYQITLPFVVLLTLDRSIFVCEFFSAFAIVGLLIGRGPCRVLVVLATFWVMFQLWAHGGVIHWA
jgi:hypothetical protein